MHEEIAWGPQSEHPLAGSNAHIKWTKPEAFLRRSAPYGVKDGVKGL